MPLRRLPALNALRAFEAAARHSSFKVAADELSVTPAAISQQIRSLEAELEVALFRREPRSVVVTAEGRRLQTGLAEAFTKMHAAVEDVRTPDHETLIITCSAPLLNKWLVPILSRFADKYPDITIQIDAKFEMANMEASAPNVAIRFGNPPDPGLYSEEIFDETLVPLASPELIERLKLETPEDIRRAPLIHDDSLIERFADAPTWSDWFEQVGINPSQANRGVHFGSYGDQAVDAAIGGVGVLLGRSLLACNDLQAGRLVSPFGPNIRLNLRYYLVCAASTEGTPAVAAFLEWARQEAAATKAIQPVP
ncbi:MAG: LysR family transcriptional regulator [Hyphomicrobiaceae bacterium]